MHNGFEEASLNTGVQHSEPHKAQGSDLVLLLLFQERGMSIKQKKIYSYWALVVQLLIKKYSDFCLIPKFRGTYPIALGKLVSWLDCTTNLVNSCNWPENQIIINYMHSQHKVSHVVMLSKSPLLQETDIGHNKK